MVCWETDTENTMRRLVLTLTVLVLVLAPGPAPMSPLADSRKGSTEAITYVARDYGFDGSETIPAGITLVEMINQGHDLHQIQFIRLPDGKTATDFNSEIMADPSRMPSWAQRRGGPNSVIPGERAVAIINLEPGNYVLICGIPDRRGIPHVALGMHKPLRVEATGNRPAAAPPADLTITEADFTFALSHPITAGLKTIHVANEGSQAHEVVVVQLAPGSSVTDFVDAFQPGVAESPLGKPIGGLVGIEPGRDGYFRIDFAPGSYGLICFLPDIVRRAPHFTRGMLMDVKVK